MVTLPFDAWGGSKVAKRKGRAAASGSGAGLIQETGF
jgi:hypothetical protein